jgi:hypothetical protein
MNDIAKLPKWAQDYIQKIQYQRDAAVEALNNFVDGQTKSNIWIEEHPCTGEKTGPVEKKKYLQTHEVVFLLGKEEIHVGFSYEKQAVRISAGWRGLVLKPSASNTIEILEESRD